MSLRSDLHQIGAVAQRTGLSLRTIRHYEEVGLVVPSGRSVGGFRLYTDADVDRLSRIKVMKPLGFSLEETAEVLLLADAAAIGSATEQQRQRLDELTSRAERTCEDLQRRLELARAFTDALRAALESTAAKTRSSRVLPG